MIGSRLVSKHYVRVRLSELDRYCEWRCVWARDLQDAVRRAEEKDDVLACLEASIFAPEGAVT